MWILLHFPRGLVGNGEISLFSCAVASLYLLYLGYYTSIFKVRNNSRIGPVGATHLTFSLESHEIIFRHSLFLFFCHSFFSLLIRARAPAAYCLRLLPTRIRKCKFYGICVICMGSRLTSGSCIDRCGKCEACEVCGATFRTSMLFQE